MHASPHRARALLALAAAWALALGGGYHLAYRPRAAELAAERTRIARVAVSVRDARRAELAFGEDGVRAETQRLRREAEHLGRLAPPASLEDRATAALRIRERLGQLALRHGVYAPHFEDVGGSDASGVRVEGIRVRASGGYHDVGAWLADALDIHRLTRIGEARLAVVPDSLLATVPPRAAGTVAAGSAPTPPQPGVAGPGAPPTAARPLEVAAELTLHWYALPAEPAAAPEHPR